MSTKQQSILSPILAIEVGTFLMTLRSLLLKIARSLKVNDD